VSIKVGQLRYGRLKRFKKHLGGGPLRGALGRYQNLTWEKYFLPRGGLKISAIVAGEKKKVRTARVRVVVEMCTPPKALTKT